MLWFRAHLRHWAPFLENVLAGKYQWNYLLYAGFKGDTGNLPSYNTASTTNSILSWCTNTGYTLCTHC